MRVIKHLVQPGLNQIHSNHLLEPVAFEYQDGELVVWSKEFENYPTTLPLQLYVATTGEQVPDKYKYVATVTNPERTTVLHLFQL